MTRVGSLLSVLMGAMLSTGAVAGCSKEKVETPPEQAAEPIAETETSAAERPVPSLPAPAGKDVEPAEPVAPEASAPDAEPARTGGGADGEASAAPRCSSGSIRTRMARSTTPSGPRCAASARRG